MARGPRLLGSTPTHYKCLYTKYAVFLLYVEGIFHISRTPRYKGEKLEKEKKMAFIDTSTNIQLAHLSFFFNFLTLVCYFDPRQSHIWRSMSLALVHLVLSFRY